MTSMYNSSFERLDIFVKEYKKRLEQALSAIAIIEKTDIESEDFSQALADLHVCATVIERYSEGLVEAIDQFTEDRPE